MLFLGRLAVPDSIKALLFDMDGVVLDTLAVEVIMAPKLLREVVHHDFTLPEDVIRANFPYDVPEFWRRVAAAVGHEATEKEVDRLTEALNEVRHTVSPPVHAGIVEIIDAARAAGLATGLVSNNPTPDILSMLDAAELRGCFDIVVGNDIEGLRKKPAPDPYLEGARRLGLAPELCVAIEDSLLGAEAASTAGCYTVGVATGACDFATLDAAKHVDVAYAGFGEQPPARMEGALA
ncbi:HAD-IA family hydrolase [Catenulispora yoronensis]|uniref:HAD-IA family hydrolase n=1 Tax=Catenulispora yoronensis TaxID=450799 RepID=A0ABN2TVZ5_9ACTN